MDEDLASSVSGRVTPLNDGDFSVNRPAIVSDDEWACE